MLKLSDPSERAMLQSAFVSGSDACVKVKGRGGVRSVRCKVLTFEASRDSARFEIVTVDENGGPTGDMVVRAA